MGLKLRKSIAKITPIKIKNIPKKTDPVIFSSKKKMPNKMLKIIRNPRKKILTTPMGINRKAWKNNN